MWLGNDALKVFFEENLGGMPTADTFDIISAVSIEIARTKPFPFFQSLNDTRPRIKRDGSKITVQGIMRKPLGEIMPHTYEMEATIEENRLNLAYRLDVARDEQIVQSKIWMWVKPFQSYAMDGETFDVKSKRSMQEEYCARSGGTWYYLEERIGQPGSITLFYPNCRLRITGSTTPPYYTEIQRYEDKKMEVVYGWARGLLKKGMYSGSLELTYEAVP